MLDHRDAAVAGDLKEKMAAVHSQVGKLKVVDFSGMRPLNVCDKSNKGDDFDVCCFRPELASEVSICDRLYMTKS